MAAVTDRLAFEQLTRRTVQELATALRTKAPFHTCRPVLELALGLEEELYKRANVSCGQREFANAWECPHASALYHELKASFISHIGAEHGAVWRRVASGQMSTKHVFEKCCPILCRYPVLKKRKPPRGGGHRDVERRDNVRTKKKKKKKHKKDPEPS